uniref:Uncharacterized protein n=1 Tax=Anguilla anguilla TaxID=7936 RepID=A0A0E9VG84_ANGAN
MCMNGSPQPLLCTLVVCGCGVKRTGWLASLRFRGEPWIAFTLLS